MLEIRAVAPLSGNTGTTEVRAGGGGGCDLLFSTTGLTPSSFGVLAPPPPFFGGGGGWLPKDDLLFSTTGLTPSSFGVLAPPPPFFGGGGGGRLPKDDLLFSVKTPPPASFGVLPPSLFGGGGGGGAFLAVGETKTGPAALYCKSAVASCSSLPTILIEDWLLECNGTRLPLPLRWCDTIADEVRREPLSEGRFISLDGTSSKDTSWAS